MVTRSLPLPVLTSSSNYHTTKGLHSKLTTNDKSIRSFDLIFERLPRASRLESCARCACHIRIKSFELNFHRRGIVSLVDRRPV